MLLELSSPSLFFMKTSSLVPFAALSECPPFAGKEAWCCFCSGVSTSMIADNTKNGRQSKSTPSGFGGEEGIKHLLLSVFIHATAGIVNLKKDIGPGFGLFGGLHEGKVVFGAHH